MKKRIEKILSVSLLVALLASMTLPMFTALSDVTPELVDIELQPGESYTEYKMVTNPPIPPMLDLLLLEDESGSFGDDIATLKGTPPDYEGLAMDIWDGIDPTVDLRGAVAGFIDFPQSPYGGTGDWPYRLIQDFTDDRTTWKNGIISLTLGWGDDEPESQLEGLMNAASLSWRDEATKIVMLVTDAPYHDSALEPGYPGPPYAATVAALNAKGIHVIVLSTATSILGVDLEAFYTDLVDDTGGVWKEIQPDSSDIVDAVFEALEEVHTDIWWVVTNCPDDITIELDPTYWLDVKGGTSHPFTETISVSEDADSGMYTCTVTFYANTYPAEGGVIGTETINILVNTPPCCEYAYADPAVLWPPNHKMVAIEIMGVTDADGDEVTITVTGVWQDEPTEGLGDGDMAPDASYSGGDVEVRAERSGLEDGRVYHISFTATDEYGGTCEGEVTVGVPHDKKDTPVDGGPLYDSTLP